MEEEPRGGECGDRDGRRVAIDDYTGVIFPVGYRKIRVDVAE